MASCNKINMEDIILMSQDLPNFVQTIQGWGVLAVEGSMMCPDCGAVMKLARVSREDGFKWECRSYIRKKGKKARKCCKRQSLRKNTFFENSHLSLKQIAIFCHLWCYNVELQHIQMEARLSNRTALEWNAFCSEVVIDFCLRQKKPIGGENMIVEIDEAKCGKMKCSIGNFLEEQWVLGGVCVKTGELFLAPVERRDASSYIPLIEKWVVPGSTIISDCWRVCDGLDEAMFRHLEVNRSINFKDPTTGADNNSNTFKGTWRYAKKKLPEYKKRDAFFVDSFAKFMFTRHCKVNDSDMTVEFFKAAGVLYNPYRHVEEPAVMEEREGSADEIAEVDEAGPSWADEITIKEEWDYSQFLE